MTSISGVLEVLGADSQRLPLVFDSPHSGTDYPADFRPIADRAAFIWMRQHANPMPDTRPCKRC